MTVMQTQRVDYPHGNISDDKKPISQEQLQREVDYVKAQQILKSMLNCGLISLSEFNKITDLNRKTFSPLLAEIML